MKVHGRCDLSCDYCYVYTMGDDRWRTRPAFMNRATITACALRIAEHAAAHRLASVDVVLHGGEPLLIGPTELDFCCRTLRSTIGPVADVRLHMQTNGVRLAERTLSLLATHGVRVGVSIDGDREAHDRHRVRATGRGSHDDVARGLRLLGSPAYRHVFGGVLCTVDTANDPVRTYEALLAFAPPAVDFLLPHGNWSAPPPRRDPASTETPYAAWLGAVFERWYRASPRETDVRLFSTIIGLLFGAAPVIESVGGAPLTSVVLETDGTIELSDSLGTAYPGAAATGLRVATDSFDDVLRLPATLALQAGTAALCAQCRECRLGRVCAGGLPAHRYRSGTEFDNPSVYCADLYALIDRIRDRVGTDVAALRGAVS